MQGLVQDDLNRLLRVRLLRQLPRPELIQRAAEDTEVEVVLAAWRLLGDLKDPLWPTAKNELYFESKLAHRLQEMLLGVNDPAGKVVRKELWT